MRSLSSTITLSASSKNANLNDDYALLINLMMLQLVEYSFHYSSVQNNWTQHFRCKPKAKM